MARVVTINHVAYVQFLIHPFGVVAVDIVIRVQTGARTVNEVLAGQQVRDHGAVDTLIVAKVDTCGQFQQALEELIVIA